MKADFSLGEIPFGLGCMSLPEGYEEAKKILALALERGVKYFDTADLYQNGRNEEILGKFFEGKRDQVILASKVGNQLNPDGKSWTWNPSKKYILEEVENSLKRLKTDYLDLYQLHGGTMEDPWEETLEAFEILKSQGKILAFGISSIRPNVVRKVMEMNPPTTLMTQYSLLDRRPEEFVFPFLEKSSTKVVVRGGMTKGILIDKPFGSYLDCSVDEISAIKKEIHSSGYSPESVLIRFALAPKVVGMMVAGASSVDQLNKNLDAFLKSKDIPEEYILYLSEKFPANKYQDHR